MQQNWLHFPAAFKAHPSKKTRSRSIGLANRFLFHVRRRHDGSSTISSSSNKTFGLNGHAGVGFYFLFRHHDHSAFRGPDSSGRLTQSLGDWPLYPRTVWRSHWGWRPCRGWLCERSQGSQPAIGGAGLPPARVNAIGRSLQQPNGFSQLLSQVLRAKTNRGLVFRQYHGWEGPRLRVIGAHCRGISAYPYSETGRASFSRGVATAIRRLGHLRLRQTKGRKPVVTQGRAPRKWRMSVPAGGNGTCAPFPEWSRFQRIGDRKGP